MSFQNEHGFCLVMTLAFSSCFSLFPEYEFEVYPVKKCPMNKEAWDLSSIRMNCNTTHGYHCVPNKFFTSLIEFCYPRGEKILFGEGNCLELADTGILNHIPCNETFSSGCPDSYYYGNEIYKYPQCLAINTTLRCFESDTKCIISRLVERSTLERNGTSEQTECSTKTHSEYYMMVTILVITILSILLDVFIICCVCVSKKKLCSWMHTCIKYRRQRNSTSNKEMKIETGDGNYMYCTPHDISSKSDTHNYNKFCHVTAEETNRELKPFVPERESSSQSDPQSFSSQSNDERDSFHKIMCDSNPLASSEDSCQSDQQSFSSQFQEQINQGYENDEFPSVSKRMPKSRKNTSRPFVITKSRPAHRSRVHTSTCPSSNSSLKMLHYVVECLLNHDDYQSTQSNHQQFPSADEIAASILAQIRTNTCLPDKAAATTTLPGVIDFAKGTTKTFGTESGSILLNEDDADNSDCDDDILNLQIQANANDHHLCQTEYLEINNLACSQKPRTVEMDRDKGESVIKKKASKQTKEEAPLEQAMAITSSYSTKKSEQKEKKKEVLSFDKIKKEKKKERLRPRERRMRDEEWRRQSEIEQEKNRSRKVDLKQETENKLAREKEKIRKDREQLEKEKLELSLERDRLEREGKKRKRLEQLREREGSNAREDLRDGFQLERSDRRDERDSERARTSLGDSQSELKSERERQGEKDTRNFETNLSWDNWEERNSSSSLQDDREMSQLGITCYSIPDNLGIAQSSQKNRKSSSDSGEVKSSCSASRIQIDNRRSGFHPQDRWIGGSLGLQADTRQKTSCTPKSSGLLEAGEQNMLQTSVPQATGIVLTNTSLTKEQNPDLTHTGACKLNLDDTEC